MFTECGIVECILYKIHSHIEAYYMYIHITCTLYTHVYTYIYLSHDVSISQILPSPLPPPLSLLSFPHLSLFPPPSQAPTIESVVAGECQEEARQHSELRPEEVLLQTLCHLVTSVCNRLERVGGEGEGRGRGAGERGGERGGEGGRDRERERGGHCHFCVQPSGEGGGGGGGLPRPID